MKYHPLLGWQASRRNPQVHRYNAPGEMVAYAALFMLLFMSGAVTLAVCELIRATGSTADTVNSIIMNLWRASAATVSFTLAAAGISKGIKLATRRLRQWISKSLAIGEELERAP